jgi:alkanesulfonate monooxygenase SsuD/methylene tetrahydromethanopterin reductase-like flavin-dependent oxidoreductase (luciferase family)
VRATRLHIEIGVDQNLLWATLVERWRLIEALGFDSIWDFDHLSQPTACSSVNSSLARGVTPSGP